MMMLCLAGVLYPLAGQSVEPRISFTENAHNFGNIKEVDGKVTHKFEFVNTGGSDLIVQNVSASCGCTASNWSREPIAPGAKGYVSATYNPKGRPGPFRKYVTVISNSNPGSVRLTISGEVEPRPRTIEDDYRYAMGSLRLKSNHMAFGNTKNTKQSEKRLPIVNHSDETLKIEFERVPKHVSIKAVPATLKPHEKGVLVATYNAAIRNDWGFVIDRMGLKINGVTDRNYTLVISANIEEDFSGMSAADLAKAPVLKVDDPEFRFGTVKQGENVEHTYLLTNEGKSDLLIRKIKASCGCTAVQPQKKVIAPGESVQLKAVFKSAGKMGKQNKTVTVITNDPQKSKMILWVKGEVIKP